MVSAGARSVIGWLRWLMVISGQAGASISTRATAAPYSPSTT
jgi:hypothetical protein